MAGRSLRWRLLGLSFATTVIALFIAGAGLSELFSRHVERRAFAELETHARVLLASLEIAPDGALLQPAPPSDPLFTKPYSGLYWQITENGKAVLRSRSLWDFEIAIPNDTLSATAVHYHLLPGPENSSLLTLERPLRLGPDGAERAFRVLVALDRKTVATTTAAFNKDLVFALAGLAMVLIAASWVQAALGLAPLGRLRDRLSAVRLGTERRLAGTAPQEIQPLIDEINGLLDERDQSIAKARARAADLAHGLKTPLTALDGDVRRLHDLGQHKLADEIGGVSALMRRHVQSELTRARIAGARTLSSTKLLVRPAIEAIVAVAARLPEGQALHYDIDIGAGDVISMERNDFDEIIGNLVENAVRHAKSVVRIAFRNRAHQVEIEVSDDGPGIPSADVERLMKRGESSDTQGSGAGLGLSIVSEILDAYGSRLLLENAVNGGLKSRFCIPLPG